MERRYVKDGMRALTLLGCEGVESLRVAKDHHLTAVPPSGARVYIRTLDELTETILTLARVLNGS